MTEETTIATVPTDEEVATARETAADLVASTVPDMVVLMQGADLLTLRFALEAEQAKGDSARKGAVAALEAAIEGHPELSASAAAAVDAPAEEAEPELVAEEGVAAQPVAEVQAQPEVAEVEPVAEQPEPEQPETPAPAEPIEPQPDAEAHTELEAEVEAAPATAGSEGFAAILAESLFADEVPERDPALDTTITTVAEPEPDAQVIEPDAVTDTTAFDLEDEPPEPGAISQAPARPHQSLVDQLDMRFIELKEFARALEGDVEGDLGQLLAFIRSKL